MPKNTLFARHQVGDERFVFGLPASLFKLRISSTLYSIRGLILWK
ncbi:MAG: hypothetical protein Q8904_09915 [Bacteroidota bacterium]|nr:hypothetical protein [Bacteroidota bacterium]